MAKAYVTLLTKPDYLPGTLVLALGLHVVRSKYPLVVMVTPDLPREARIVLHKRGIMTYDIEALRPRGPHTLDAYDARFAETWTKLRAFELVEFERVVLLDSDMVILQNMDELLDELVLPADEVAAAHVCACNPRKLKHFPADWVPENCAHSAVKSPTMPPPVPSAHAPRPYGQLNSGTVVLNPSRDLANRIYSFLYQSERIASFTFPDQDLLAAFFQGKWRPLSWRYNALRTLRDLHTQEWRDDMVKCVHYILPEKPWHARVPAKGTMRGEFDEVNRWWWDHYDAMAREIKVTDPDGWVLVNKYVAHPSQ
ncbi:glycosyltransferase family 8 protein [Fistulina hepatica ATCC 64428]|uniref:Glycosyltransferase family 8 protein n=1 Tax=Fistulina hepatica ATCC 64428 TaxID=1128425 RepID=A0A0D7A3T7_9AGAR|nr:glycosyltransferase family 8 protein [Fistulina hepatica ATCC 64428]